MNLYEAFDAYDEGGREIVGATVVLALDRPASIDAILPSWICRDGRLRGVPIHMVAIDVKLIEVSVDNKRRRVLGVDPGRWYPTEVETVPGTVPYPESPCDETD